MACSGQNRVERVEVECAYCGAPKWVVPSLKERLNAFYCNKDCRFKHWKTLIQGEGNPNYRKVVVECSGCSIPTLVQPHRVRNRRFQFCSADCYRKNIGKFFTGENNPLWNPDITDEERNATRRVSGYSTWRTDVYRRDDFTCQVCGCRKGGNLVAHHLDGWNIFPNKRLSVDNGITLCRECHKDFHKNYGYGNNTAEQFYEYVGILDEAC